MIAQAASVNATEDLVVDARMANEGDGWSGLGANPFIVGPLRVNPWRLAPDTESVLYLTNETW
jgi:hypothetical protein